MVAHVYRRWRKEEHTHVYTHIRPHTHPLILNHSVENPAYCTIHIPFYFSVITLNCNDSLIILIFFLAWLCPLIIKNKSL